MFTRAFAAEFPAKSEEITNALHILRNRPDFCYLSVRAFIPPQIPAIDKRETLRQSRRVATMSRRSPNKMWLADEDFPMRIRLSRAQQGWSQKQLSAVCGGRPGWRTISDWERGLVHEPHLAELSRVAAAVREDVLWLLRGEENIRGVSSRHS